ncbi:hypothetical protein CNR22_01945 [Sphingobacteriaceae bacterium]|nr:hypothetical protein CNR22_01945 [Sphingobacteriaceae bacterium]
MNNKILVTGATGTIGQALIKGLQNKNTSFVAGVRDTKQAAEKIPGTTLVRFDFGDPSTYETATEGVNKVFLLGPPLNLNLVELISPFIDFLKKKNITRVVYVSALAMEKVKELPFHVTLVKKLQDEGFDYTILNLSFFSQNFKSYEWDNIKERGITYMPAGTGKVGFVDVYDIGEAAAIVLTEEGHEKKTYQLTGPDLLSYGDAAEILSEVTGKTIVYPNPSPEEYTSVLKSAGAPDFIAPYMISVYSLIANNEVSVLTDDIEKITGKKPQTLKAVLSRDFQSL